MTSHPVEGPMSGVRVLDFSQALSGPYAAMLLADLGASVIKIEHPDGEMLRASGPYAEELDLGLYYLATNRNKRSLALDLKSRHANEVVARLVRQSDVVIENFRPGVAARLGISFEELRSHNESLVHLSISGYGATGPMSQWGGFDQVVQGVSGLMSVTGMDQPTRVGIPIADILAGVYGALGVAAALRRRDETGSGEAVELSLLSSLIASMGVVGQEHLATGRVPSLAQNDHPVLYPYGVFQANDGPFNVAVASDAMWQKLCRVIGADGLEADPAYKNNDARVAAKSHLRDQLNEIFGRRSRAEWSQYLNENGIPAGPINSMDEVFASEQVQDQRLVITLSDPVAGKVQMLGTPWHFSGGVDPARVSAPRLGEHSSEILSGLEFTSSEISLLFESGTVVDGSLL